MATRAKRCFVCARPTRPGDMMFQCGVGFNPKRRFDMGSGPRNTCRTCRLVQLGLRFTPRDEEFVRKYIRSVEQREWWALLVDSRLTLVPENEQGQRKFLCNMEERARCALHINFLLVEFSLGRTSLMHNARERDTSRLIREAVLRKIIRGVQHTG